MILQEIPEDGVKKLLSNKESLAACDVAVFVYDRSGCFGLLIVAILSGYFKIVKSYHLCNFFYEFFAFSDNIWIECSGSH